MRKDLISETAMRAARSSGNPKAPVLIDGKAMLLMPLRSAKLNEDR